MDWKLLVSFVDAGKLAGYSRAVVAVLLGAAVAKWSWLGGFLTPEAQTALGIVVASIVVGLWSHIAKYLTEGKFLVAFLVLGIGIAFAVSLPAPAQAATTALTPEAVAANIKKAAAADIQNAITMAKAASTPQSGVRLQCYEAIAKVAFPASTDSLAKPHLVSDYEYLAELIDALQPTSPTLIACAGAAQLQLQTALQFINAVVTGVAGAAAIVPKVP